MNQTFVSSAIVGSADGTTMRVLALLIAAAALGLLSGGADAKITYTLHLDGVSSSIANQVRQKRRRSFWVSGRCLVKV